jgi:hypothetical protein
VSFGVGSGVKYVAKAEVIVTLENLGIAVPLKEY